MHEIDRMAGKIHPLMLLLLVGSIAAGATAWLDRSQPLAVVTVAAEHGVVEESVSNTRSGTVKACRRAMLSPGAGGQIARLNVTEGDRVTQGELLLELWNRDLQAEVALGEAKSAAAAATARATCLYAQVARREAERLLKLKGSGAVSAERVDQSVTGAQARSADCESATTRTAISTAEVDVIQAHLERTRLYAPFGGVVAEVNGEVSEYATPSPPGIATLPAIDLVDDTCFYVAAPIDEVDARRVQVGQVARITLDAFGDRRFVGHVRRVAPYVYDRERQARTVEVEVAFDEAGDVAEMLAGFSADVEIILEVATTALRIPSSALLEGDHLWVLNRAGTLERRRVETALANWTVTQVVSGLALGERVVTSVDLKAIAEGVSAVHVEALPE